MFGWLSNNNRCSECGFILTTNHMSYDKVRELQQQYGGGALRHSSNGSGMCDACFDIEAQKLTRQNDERIRESFRQRKQQGGTNWL